MTSAGGVTPIWNALRSRGEHRRLDHAGQQSRGMLETSLALLVPSDGGSLVDFATDACRSAVLARALDARLPLGLAFAQWFMELFRIPPRLEPLP